MNKMTNFENLINFITRPDDNLSVGNIAQLLVVKKDDYNYTSNLLFENFLTRKQAVDAIIDKLNDTYHIGEFGVLDKIFKEENPDLD